MLLSLDLNEHLINEESVTISLMLPSQTLSILWSKLITPQANGFIADRDAPLGHQVFDVTMTQIETMVKPHCLLNDFERGSVAFV
jgi:hypothetical protein